MLQHNVTAQPKINTRYYSPCTTGVTEWQQENHQYDGDKDLKYSEAINVQVCINVQGHIAEYSVECSQSWKASLVPSVIADSHTDIQTDSHTRDPQADSHTGDPQTLPCIETSQGNEPYDLKNYVCKIVQTLSMPIKI